MDKIWQLSSSVGAKRVLFAVAFTESIFFPIPPDLLLVPMILAKRHEAFKIAGVCLAGNLLGAAAGYFIGKFFMDALGMPIINFYALQDQYLQVQQWYDSYSAFAVAAAALTPIPYKLCTITAGAFDINFFTFMLVSLLARGFRFFAISGLLYLFGEKVRFFIEKRLDIIMLLTLIGVVVGFAVFKFLLS
ncbi:MAG: DedA family protein [Desulfovibrionaceae bacterium]|nr:DedA family protein [Desulfovibrionaceae bacterium]